MSAVITSSSDAESASWEALGKVSKLCPDGWVVVGGFATKYLLISRSLPFGRSTTDGDIILNLRGSYNILPKMEYAFQKSGMVAMLNPSGHNHRWHHPESGALIDVLVPTGMGSRWEKKFPGFGYLLSTRGAQFEIDHSEKVACIIDGKSYDIRFPTVMGALYGKCSAFLNVGDADKTRHAEDVASICQMVSAEEHDQFQKLSFQQKRRIVSGLYKSQDILGSDPAIDHAVELFSI